MAESKLELTPVRCGCGGEAKVETVTTRFEQVPRFRIRCEKCNISTIWDYFAEADAIEAWNRAMGGVAKNATTERTAQDCAENARCNERMAKVSKGAYDLMRCECGMPVSSNFDFCPRCRARLIWRED